MRKETKYFMYGALSVLALKAFYNLTIAVEDERREKERAKKSNIEDEDLEMLDEDIYNEEW